MANLGDRAEQRLHAAERRNPGQRRHAGDRAGSKDQGQVSPNARRLALTLFGGFGGLAWAKTLSYHRQFLLSLRGVSDGSPAKT